MRLLEVKGLNVHYGAIHALKDVSLEVNSGDIVVLIGSNGAGKSTLLRTISGLIAPTSGEIVFMGAPLNGLKAYQIARMGIAQVPEGRMVFPGLTVKENLLMGAYGHLKKGQFKANSEKVCELFPRLKERYWQKAGTLSGGEQQMLAIGRALMAEPHLMLLDEPSLGLAPVLVDQVFESIQRIKETGTTILLVEQNAFESLRIGDRGYVLQTGVVELQDTCSNLRKDATVRKAYLGE